MHAGIDGNPNHCATNDIEKIFRILRVARKTWLVELDKVHSSFHKIQQLFANDGQECLGHFLATSINIATANTSSQSERAWNGHLRRHIRADLTEPLEFFHTTQPGRSGQRGNGGVFPALIVPGGTPEAGYRKALKAVEIVVKTEVEIDSLDLAIGDPLQPSMNLIGHNSSYSVGYRLFTVDRPELTRILAYSSCKKLIPARNWPATHDGCFKRLWFHDRLNPDLERSGWSDPPDG